ncbi:MAG: hypothetical protein ABIJ96_13570, partial [Elusimicrobiota bacterium]
PRQTGKGGQVVRRLFNVQSGPDLGSHGLTSRVKSFLTSHRNLVSTGREVFLLLSGLFVQGLLEDQGLTALIDAAIK